MRLLDRYLLRELLVPLGYCLGGFLIFWVSFDLISEVEEFQRMKLKGWEVAQFYALRLPEFLVLIGPIGLLLALLYALTNHARHHELTAIRAAGVSLWRLCAPYVGVGLLLSMGLSAVSELVAPACAVFAEQVLTRHQPSRGNLTKSWLRNLSFKNARENRTWLIEAYNPDTYEMIRPRVVWEQPDGSIRDITAARGGRVGDQWAFFNVQEFFYTNRTALVVPSQTNTLYLSGFTETPAQIESELKISSLSSIQAARKVQLSVAEIVNYLGLHPVLMSSDRAMLYTQLHVRLAKPWTSLVVVLIAIPFGAASGRRNAFVGVASSIFICFTFYVVSQFGMALGTGGHLEPWVAGWLPNILFSAAGVALAMRIR
ncbi:MAG TPA: LptF/LptG family permease [Verrucomicrobiae bacterium]